MKALKTLASTAALAVACALSLPAGAAADFGTSHFDVTFEESSGNYITAAGSHPDVLRTSIGFNYSGEGGAAVPDGDIQNFGIAQIPGLVGDTTAIPRCSNSVFTSTEGVCPANAQVGEVELLLRTPNNVVTDKVFNLTPPPGTLLRLGFKGLSLVPVVVDVTLAGPPDYNALALTRYGHQTLKVFGVELALWGVPADHGTGAPDVPFLTLPSSCLGPQLTTYEALSWPSFDAASDTLIAPVSDSGGVLTHDQGEPPTPEGFHGCGELGFSPEVEAAPTTTSAQSPSGLELTVGVDDPGLTSKSARAGSAVRRTVVTLPEGMSANPSLAEGLAVCSEAQLDGETAFSAPGEGCPQASKIGTAEVQSPLVEQTLHGSLFIAEPYANRFGSLLALYIVVKSPELGVVVHQAVKVEPDPDTGQLVAIADDVPQLPFSRFTVRLREGGRSPLISPPGCGPHAIETEFTPWAGGPAVSESAGFEISQGPGGSPCLPGGALPFDPGFTAGSLNNAAGAFSPFYMRLTRADGEQDLTRLSAILPRGVIAKIAGVGRCSDAQIAIAKARTGPHGGQEEIDHPACPPSSRIGTATGGAGVGTELTYVSGGLYLAGPYNGAPLSVAAIVPAKAGPFDAGTVVVRTALRVNPVSGVAEVDGSASDPLPHILKGIPLNVRDLRVNTDRPNFTLNPTSCREGSTLATLWGGGSVFNPSPETPIQRSERYQAAGCASLDFRPRLAIRLLGGATKRGGHPALRAVVSPRPGDANFARAVVTLPRSAFLDQAHIRTICTRVQFAAGAGHGAECPRGAIYGRARAWSPLLDEPAEGPVFLRSSDNNLPDLVVALKGPPQARVDVELSARIDSRRGGIRSTFTGIPDLPVSRFILDMQGGKKGLIVNSRHLCFKPKRNRAKANLRGQNGRILRSRPIVRAQGCGKKKRRRARRSAVRNVSRASALR